MRILAFFICIFLAGCGYMPLSYYSKQGIGENIYVDSIVNLSDPQNSVLAKDALNRAILTRFHSNLVSKSNAETIITMNIVDINLDSIADSRNGFANFYRASVQIEFSYADKRGIERVFRNYGSYDFSVDTLSTITDDRRFSALTQASIQAIDKFIAQVAYHWR